MRGTDLVAWFWGPVSTQQRIRTLLDSSPATVLLPAAQCNSHHLCGQESGSPLGQFQNALGPIKDF